MHASASMIFHTLLLAQLSKYLADIFFNLSVYLFASVLRCKDDVVLASILRVRCAFDLVLFYFIEHVKTSLILCVMRMPNPTHYIMEAFLRKLKYFIFPQ